MKGMTINDQAAPEAGKSFFCHPVQFPVVRIIVRPENLFPLIRRQSVPERRQIAARSIDGAHADLSHFFLVVIPEPFRVANQTADGKNQTVAEVKIK